MCHVQITGTPTAGPGGREIEMLPIGRHARCHIIVRCVDEGLQGVIDRPLIIMGIIHIEIRVVISHISRYGFIMIPRNKHLHELKGLLKSYPVVGIIGPRQIGKTTLAKQVAKQHKGPVTHFDLEDERDLARLADAELTLAPLRGLVILDEIQRRPELFPHSTSGCP